MDLGIRGKVAIVTASSDGLGKAIAERMAEEGCDLALFARSQDKLQATAGELAERFGVRAIAVPGDMSKAADVDRLRATVEATFGGLDILMLNTGRPPTRMRTVLEETDDERWNTAYETQLRGALLVTRKIVPMMLGRGWGRVVAVTSASVKHPMPKHALSTVFRSGVVGLLRHLANEVADQGVTVNMVMPASVGTDALVGNYDPAERIKMVPMRRLGRPEELAAAAAFFASDLAGFTTGASLQVDGGMTASLL